MGASDSKGAEWAVLLTGAQKVVVHPVDGGQKCRSRSMFVER